MSELHSNIPPTVEVLRAKALNTLQKAKQLETTQKNSGAKWVRSADNKTARLVK